MTIGRQRSSLTRALSYNAASLTLATPCNVASSGGTTATVFGTGFGVMASSLRALATTSPSAVTSLECSVWRSDSSLSGRVASGISSWIGIRIVQATVGMQLGSMTSVLSYNTASLNSTSPFNAAISGSKSIIAFGRAYGAVGVSGRLRFCVASSSFTSTASENSIWTSDSSLSGRVGSGVGTGFDIRLVVATVLTQLISNVISLSYNAASFSLINPSNVVASGSMPLTVLGRGFGFSSFSGSLRFSMASGSTSSTASESSVWRSDSSMIGRVPSGIGAGSSVGIVFATVGRQIGSTTSALSYNAASIVLNSSVVVSTGSSVFTVIGCGFNFLSGVSFSARGVTSLSNVGWASSSSLSLKFCPGIGKIASLVVTPARLPKILYSRSSLFVFSFQATVVSTTAAFCSTGGPWVAISGQDFGIFSSTARLRFFSTSFESSLWISSSKLACKSNSLLRTIPSVVSKVTIGSVVSGLLGNVSYIPSLISANNNVTTLPSSGAFVIAFYGSDFGIRDSCSRSKIAGQNCIVVSAHSLSTLCNVQAPLHLAAPGFLNLELRSKPTGPLHKLLNFFCHFLNTINQGNRR